ncbi:MAG: helix-turn-helix domain-containing protein [Gammaproteobacteria bacterium]|jgi:DNA-binding XRE family transcriptional regulator|uniref:Helix-turn-helix n=1 Tax=Marinomonas polaris DSM 16579 TaxID=1122206 RepID=A0A1M4WSM9_9GAMM|nr:MULTISPECIES: helix-turn-helix transcriptional regulator [Marinomonas]MBU1296980.1 helix-turn-helix domain-containing protein [Gammaproteobacteria bacterium]MBU1468458.1 helix-turn-helix domain-containing protein [Gammaproteobacteria bacterium]MBU2024470.1 helix-turn-helix domain-containing protein [Gammaproteobacteria bacterium]MBU2237912.1 helix-turn-helix domain-containing protein [Gammaproteobacteria bacterium]MBU2321301.1 helix-turn-helix domain-containing protein [Gammaproteobacteria |tara:strand:+ start:3638 stop:3967 length:330 start_codon:yes stop_codon:yes gene_type:complete
MSMTAEQRQALLVALLQKHLLGEITQGQMLKRLRKEVLGFSQTRYAELVGVSRRTLTDIEQDKGSQMQSIIDKVFKPLGMKSGLTPIHPHVAKQMMAGAQLDGDLKVKP